MSLSSSAATAVTSPTRTTATCHLSFSGSADLTRSRRASRHMRSISTFTTGGAGGCESEAAMADAAALIAVATQVTFSVTRVNKPRG